MRSIKLIAAIVFIALVFISVAAESLAYPPFLRGARKFGAKDCTFCHVNAEGGEPFNERGKWLASEKERRKAEVVDPAWLSDYKPAVGEPLKGPERHSPAPPRDPVRNELEKLLVEWIEAVKQRDAATVGRILADDYIATDEQGRVIGKSEYVAGIDGMTLESYSLHDLAVRTYGDTAVMTLLWKMKASYQGKDFSGEYRETNVWVKKDGRWQVVATHVSRVAK